MPASRRRGESGFPRRLPGRVVQTALYARVILEEDRLERIIGNLAKVKLKLDEAFFYLDEIEELIQEEALSEESGAKVGRANERLVSELSGLTTRVADLQEILVALDRQDAEEVSASEVPEGPEA